ncbi:hypothetical protein PG988_007777 [Apiospora saccharicola]
MIRKIYDNLRPGGWFESHDFAFEMIPADAASEVTWPVSSMARWIELVCEGINLVGRDLRVVKHYERWLIETGFVDVKQKVLFSPTNPWPLDPKDREIGYYFEEDIVQGLEGVGMKALQLKGMTLEEIRALTELAKQDIMNRQLRLYTPLYVIYGRKPFVGEQTGGGVTGIHPAATGDVSPSQSA